MYQEHFWLLSTLGVIPPDEQVHKCLVFGGRTFIQSERWCVIITRIMLSLSNIIMFLLIMLWFFVCFSLSDSCSKDHCDKCAGDFFFLKKIIFQVRVVLFFRWGKRRKSHGDGYLPLLLLFSLLFCNGAWLSYKEDLFSCFGVWDVFVDMCFVIRAVTELRKGHLLFIIYLAMLGNESSCFRLEWGAVPCDDR